MDNMLIAATKFTDPSWQAFANVNVFFFLVFENLFFNF